ncbi:VanZ family protein [Parabacteroides sp. FAFU027]|uniref:VanZ family protein n=1 Tax=Parabacteroides sp. FAFU027 TaxID=2922715 RepID=UPI003979E33F
MRKFKAIYLLSPTVYLVIAYLSLAPRHFKSPIDLGFLAPDKAVHFTMYLVAAFATMFELSRLRLLGNKRNIIWLAIVLPILFGGLMEILQLYVPFRSCDIRDFIANSLGAIVGFILFRIISVRLSWISRDQSPSQDRDRESR